LLGKAVNYALSQWARLLVYLDHGSMTPDNNRAENAIRPFVSAVICKYHQPGHLKMRELLFHLFFSFLP
jgi:hypothetical protein